MYPHLFFCDCRRRICGPPTSSVVFDQKLRGKGEKTEELFLECMSFEMSNLANLDRRDLKKVKVNQRMSNRFWFHLR